ncbi:hypothetical protein BDR07DRAFT_1484937 [Suillus spraguei]|nr:hypothetical protein BDR07DRAFT_1484937 [Suillus spraguei]
MPETPASTSGTPNTGHHWQPMKLNLQDISCTLNMAASTACISQYQMEAANNPPSSAWIMYFKAGLQWGSIHLLCHSCSTQLQGTFSVVPSPVAHVLTLYPMLTWNTVPDHIFSSHLCQFDDVAAPGHPSRIIPSYDTPWWMGHTKILNEPWQWGQIMRSCVVHYQHWMENGVEDDGLVLPEDVNDSSGPSVMGLKMI